MGGVLHGRQQKEKYCSNSFGKSGTQLCKSGSGQQMYVLPASAQATDGNEKAFPIRKRHTEENTAICVRKLTYMAVFLEKRFGQFIFSVLSLKIYSRQSAR